jgi:hypothetical protein
MKIRTLSADEVLGFEHWSINSFYEVTQGHRVVDCGTTVVKGHVINATETPSAPVIANWNYGAPLVAENQI